MAKITFIIQENESLTVEAYSGSVMELAVAHRVKGIDGDCGGVCSCGTCHVYVSPEDMPKVGRPGKFEKDTLEYDDNANEYSRLSCQIPISEALDGIEFKVAN